MKLHNRAKWYSAMNKGEHELKIKHGLKFRYFCYADLTCILTSRQSG